MQWTVHTPEIRTGPKDRAGFIDAPLIGACPEYVQRDCPADSKPCRQAHRPPVSGYRFDDKHQDGGDQYLHGQRVQDWGGREIFAECEHVAE